MCEDRDQPWCVLVQIVHVARSGYGRDRLEANLLNKPTGQLIAGRGDPYQGLDQRQRGVVPAHLEKLCECCLGYLD